MRLLRRVLYRGGETLRRRGLNLFSGLRGRCGGRFSAVSEGFIGEVRLRVGEDIVCGLWWWLSYKKDCMMSPIAVAR